MQLYGRMEDIPRLLLAAHNISSNLLVRGLPFKHRRKQIIYYILTCSSQMLICLPQISTDVLNDCIMAWTQEAHTVEGVGRLTSLN